jgi:hypothetical protein
MKLLIVLDVDKYGATVEITAAAVANDDDEQRLVDLKERYDALGIDARLVTPDAMHDLEADCFTEEQDRKLEAASDYTCDGD